jgi:predicted dehydrogenase
MRYHPLVRKLKEVLDSGEYGECFHLSLWTQQWTKFPGDDPWAHKIATLGGGQLFSHGCHYIDLMLWYLGEPVHGTHTGTNFGTEWMEREGTSDVSIKFANGAVGYHGGTWGARGSKLHYCFQAHCTDGFLEANFLEGKLVVVKGKEETELFHTTTGKHVQNEMTHFLDCIETGRIPETDGLSSLQSLRVIWRLYEAEDAGRVADLRGLGLAHAGK